MIAGPVGQGRRQVLVYKLNGGEPIAGELTELKKTGVRLAMPRPLDDGEVVRLIMPPSVGRASSLGRTIIGHVVMTGSAAAGHLVGIDFGWETSVGVRSAGLKPKRPWWRRLFLREAPGAGSSRVSRTTRGRWSSR